MNAPVRLQTQQQIKLRMQDFFAIDEAGALAGYGRTELIDGSIYTVAPQHRPHARLKMHLASAAQEALRAAGSSLFVFAEVTVAMPPYDAPLPDIVISDDPEGDGAVPLASVALIAEVSSTTLEDDLGAKRRLYALQGVPEYWVADLASRTMHRMWEPSGEDYARSDRLSLDDRICSATITGLEIDLPA